MIILDTNVISEPLERHASRSVIDWVQGQPRDSLYLTAISLAELLAGIAILPAGRRKTELHDGMMALISDVFEDRILPFERSAAVAFAHISARARSMGRPIGLADGQIAAIAMTGGFSVATRDSQPFETAGITVIDPWTAPL